MKRNRTMIEKLYYYQRMTIAAKADGRKLLAKYYNWRYNRLNDKIYRQYGK